MDNETLLGWKEEAGGTWTKEFIPGLEGQVFHSNGYWVAELVIVTEQTWENGDPMKERLEVQSSFNRRSLLDILRDTDKLAVRIFAVAKEVQP